MKKSIFVLLAILLISISFASLIDNVVKQSDSMKTIQCIVTATNYSHRTTTIQYIFKFKREGKKMYIEYLKPSNMKGAKIAIDDKYFYNYIPNLHRYMKRKITDSKNNPGKEMGILYFIVNGDMNLFLKDRQTNFISENKKTFEYQFISKSEKEVVVFDKKSLFPVDISIYINNHLSLKMNVKNIVMNDQIPDSTFVLVK